MLRSMLRVPLPRLVVPWRGLSEAASPVRPLIMKWSLEKHGLITIQPVPDDTRGSEQRPACPSGGEHVYTDYLHRALILFF